MGFETYREKRETPAAPGDNSHFLIRIKVAHRLTGDSENCVEDAECREAYRQCKSNSEFLSFVGGSAAGL